MLIDDLPVDRRLIISLSHLGFTETTEIQAKAVPIAVAGKDLLASSKTGSGKTLAYLLPAMQRVLKTRALTKRDPRVLILTPTRELAKQVYAQLRLLVSNTSLKSTLVSGGENFNDQVKALDKDPHFVVGTPGRIVDHLKKGLLHLEGLELLILDEADRMLDLGFAEQLKAVNSAANHRLRQTLLFSATLGHAEVNEFASELLKAPVRIAIGEENQQHSEISQRFYLADNLNQKEKLLFHFIKNEEIKQAIIFTATRLDAQRLSAALSEKGYGTLALHGDLTQNNRNSIMDSFSRGKAQLLVTTDIASRGLDLLNVSHVINFDIPKHTEEYIHRIGRTGRAGEKGDAISIIGPKDWVNFKKVEEFVQRQLTFNRVDGIKPQFKGIVEKVVKAPETKVVSHKAEKKQSSKTRKPKAAPNKIFHEAEEAGFTPMRRKKKIEE
ncbi:ATP-dependent RNA helicase, DEAD box family protein [Psychromonas ingrahamii 37]|uniref:ATP-dependent RNA helicase, DEAD box family protein n=1 Tax=Psychromonas ingrahamii (strain DSM 17664 / CCUG 51855 / 37) TaxID=357804 RepID=A1STA9_PSYIN|nr:DEAD/DEAH box helicase [Psychromonas ingrahamii]ABM02724.1 ATP-dependent RNA helicase, DEAD box family protein [Psychromonas ingrahamii 37]